MKLVATATSRKQLKKQANIAANAAAADASNRSGRIGQELSIASCRPCKTRKQGCSFEEFAMIYRACIGDPHGCNLQNMHKKLLEFRPAELRTVMQWQKHDEAFQAESSFVVPHLKTKSYIDFCLKQGMPLQVLPATCGGLREKSVFMALLYMERTGTKQFGDKALFRDVFCVNEIETKSQFNAALARAFRNITSNPVEIEKRGSVLLARSPKDCCVLSRIVLPSFIDELLRSLGHAGPDQELVIVPFDKDLIFATLSSSPKGCFMLGEMMDSMSDDTPDSVMPCPFRIHTIDRGSAELTLLANGITPVTWDIYSYFGSNRYLYHGAEEDVTCFPIPRSKKEAAIARKMHAFSELPTSDFSVRAVGDCWADYIESRSVESPFVHELTQMLTFPLTVVSAIRKFGLEFDAGSTVRIDIPGSEAQESQKGIWNELGHALPFNEIQLRLVGPRIEERSAEHTNNLTITWHKCLYEDLLDNGACSPHLVVAFNAGIRDSWQSVVTTLMEKSIPFVITGFDVTDVGVGLKTIWLDFNLKPHIVLDGMNPFGCATEFSLDFGTRAADLMPESTSGNLVQEHAQQLLELETKLLSQEPSQHSHADLLVMLAQLLPSTRHGCSFMGRNNVAAPVATIGSEAMCHVSPGSTYQYVMPSLWLAKHLLRCQEMCAGGNL